MFYCVKCKKEKDELVQYSFCLDCMTSERTAILSLSSYLDEIKKYPHEKISKYIIIKDLESILSRADL